MRRGVAMADIAELGIKVLSGDIVKATKRLDKLERQSKDNVKANKNLGGSFGMLGAAVTAFAGTLAVGKFFKTAASFESMSVSLETVTGSAEKATMAMAGIQEFAKNTPFQVAEITSAFIKLKALGIAPTEDSLRSFGNTSSAMGKSLDQMIEAVADASTGEFERLKEFGIKARKQGDEVKFTFQGVTTTVKNSSEEITGYLEDIGTTKFAGAMSKQMDTLNGKVSNLGDSFDKLIIKLAADQTGAKGILDLAIDSVDWLTGGITDMRIGIVETIALFDEYFTRVSFGAQALKDNITGIFDSSEKNLSIRKELNDELTREIGIIKSATEAYIEGEKEKEKATGSIAQAGAESESSIVSRRAVELALVAELEDEAMLNKASRDQEEMERISDFNEQKLAVEMDYYDRLYNMQSGSQQAALDFSFAMRMNDYRGALKHGSLMLANAAKQNKEAFELQKALALANAVVTLPSAVMKSFENGGGYPFGLIPAGLMLAQGLQQINTIKSTSFGSKSASGGSVGGGGGVSSSAPVASGLPAGSTAVPSGHEGGVTNVQLIGQDKSFSSEQIDSLFDEIGDAMERGDKVLFTSESRQALELTA